MGNTSKDLLHLEHKNPSTSSLESALLVCKNDSLDSQRIKKTNPHEKPLPSPLPRSQVLGKVKDFLGVISESNKRLELDAKDNSENYDIELLTGDESQVIEMDLMLGIADLHTPEAVAAAESVISGFQPVIPLADTSSESESDTDSESESESESEDTSDEDVGGELKVNRPKSHMDNSSTTEVTEVASNKKSRKRPRIVEL